MNRRSAGLADEPSQGAHGAVGYLFDWAGGVDALQDALVGVVGDQGGRLVLVDLDAVPDRLFAVVVALEQVAAAVVTGVFAGRGVEQDVPDAAATVAGAAA